MKPLTQFPESFKPIVVVTGDRREVPPQTKGDVLAYSVSNTDFMFLTHLGLEDSEVVSDKQFVIDSEDLLHRRFGNTNVLVVGSPAVNLLARRINEAAAFRFSISPETYKELNEQYRFMDDYIQDERDLFVYHQCLDGILDVETIVKRFVDLDPTLEDLRKRAQRIVKYFLKTQICQYLQTHPRPVRYLMHKLDKPGIYDSLAGVNRGDTIGPYKDYGLVSVLKNPFSQSDEFNVVYVAGVHGPGTALGLRLLSQKKAFASHPYGGIYDVTIERFKLYFDKIQASRERWETRAYDDKIYLRCIIAGSKPAKKVFLSSPGGKDDKKQRVFNQRLIKELIRIGKEMNIDLYIEDPYTIALGGGTNFWDPILEYEEECSFVIHDITKCSRGVMVEIGFTVGHKKVHFLVWNRRKIVVTNWEEMNIPKLLPTINIEILDFNDRKNTTKTIRKKIIEKALGGKGSSNCSTCDCTNTKEDSKTYYVYAKEPELLRFLESKLSERDIRRSIEEDFKDELRLCRICRALRKSNGAFVEISDDDRNGYIVLGMAKAIGIQTFPVALAKFQPKEFPWAKEVVNYQIASLEQRLGLKVAQFLAY